MVTGLVAAVAGFFLANRMAKKAGIQISRIDPAVPHAMPPILIFCIGLLVMGAGAVVLVSKGFADQDSIAVTFFGAAATAIGIVAMGTKIPEYKGLAYKMICLSLGLLLILLGVGSLLAKVAFSPFSHAVNASADGNFWLWAGLTASSLIAGSLVIRFSLTGDKDAEPDSAPSGP